MKKLGTLTQVQTAFLLVRLYNAAFVKRKNKIERALTITKHTSSVAVTEMNAQPEAINANILGTLSMA